MEGAHPHLLVNHVSLFAIIGGTILLAISMKRRSADLRMVAVALFLIAGLCGWIAMETGEMAEDVVKKLGGDTHDFIEAHEGAANWALRSAVFVGLLAVGTEWAIRKHKHWAKALQWALLVFAIHGCTVFARTAYLGGLIRHTEVRD